MVHIEQPEAFELLAQMEGKRWCRSQRLHPEAPYGFDFWLRAWKTKLAAGLRNVPAPLTSFADRATRAPIIYGEEGYRKYRVNADGEIVLTQDAGLSPVQASRARSLGFSIQ